MLQKLCVITDINTMKPGANEAFAAVKRMVFEGLSLALFHRRDYYNLPHSRQKKLTESVSFTTCYSVLSEKPGDGFQTLVLLGRDSLKLYGPEVSFKDFKNWYGKQIDLGEGRAAIVAQSSYNMVQWLHNPTHKASESGVNRATHYIRTAYQILTNSLPLSTQTEIKFTLNVKDIEEMCSHVQATKYAYFDVETFPAERNVPKEKRLEYNTTFFKAKCRTLQISHQAGAAWVVPIYDFESPLNVGYRDELEFGILTEVEEDGKPCKIFTKVITKKEDFHKLPESVNIHVKRNGELIQTYDWYDLPFRREFAIALYENWTHCKENHIDNYFKDLCFPLIEKHVTNDHEVEKRAHNVTFDYNVCRYPGQGLGFQFKGILGDTMEQIHTLDKTKPLGLKPLSELYYPEFIGYGEEIDYENDSLYDIGVYGGTDTDLGARLDTFLTKDLLTIPKLFRFYVNVKVPNIYFFADLEYNGCYIDRPKLSEVKEITKNKGNIFLDRLNNIEEVQNYVLQRLKKEREEAIEIINLKLTDWVTTWLPKVEARLKKMELEGKDFKANGEPYKAYATALGQKAWIVNSVEDGYFDPKSPFMYKRPIDLQQERLEVETGQADKAYLFDENPSEAQQDHGTYYIVDGKTKYITASKKDLFREMNYNSTDHLGDFVYLSPYGLRNEMPFTNAKETDPTTGRKRNVRKQRPTTTRKEISSLPDPTGFLNTLMIYKALMYVHQSCEEIEDKLDSKGYIHTQYNYTNTDRSKSSRPNLQNVMQRSPFEEVRECVDLYKSMFTVPDKENYVYYKRDLSQAELRWFCYVYRIYSMAKAYDNDEDLHIKTAAAIMKMTEQEFKQLPKAEYKIHRTEVGKGNNFGNIYGISAKGFQEYVRLLFGRVITIQEAEKEQAEFFKIYPEILKAHQKQKLLIHQVGYSETPFGNRRDLPDLDSSVPYFQAEAERHGINQPVQGAAGVAMMFSAVIFKLRQKVLGLSGGTINLIHDDIPGYMRKDESYRYQIELREACNNPPFMQYFGFEMDIAKMKSDAEVGTDWSNVKELPDLVKILQEKDESFFVNETEEVLLTLYPNQNPQFLPKQKEVII